MKGFSHLKTNPGNIISQGIYTFSFNFHFNLSGRMKLKNDIYNSLDFLL